MAVYSPIAATYGVRVEQLLETVDDYRRYHSKLNKKLQSLRHRCQVVTRDTRKYASKEKYSKFDSDEYDRKNKLYGVLVLLHAERDLSLVNVLKLRARQRGKLKTSEKKVLSTRLKKVVQTTERLLKLTKNENQWITRIQYIIYSKLARAEYLAHGKFSKRKDSETISKELALSFAALSHLESLRLLPQSTLEFLQATYEYTLKQHAGNLLSSAELENFIVEQVVEAKEAEDELAKLLFANGYDKKSHDINMDNVASIKRIQWRAFTAEIHDFQVEQSIQEAKSIMIKNVSNYDEKLLKWQQALERQESRIQSYEDQAIEEDTGADNPENDQILLAFIKYNMLFTSISRDNYLFNQLWKQWNQLGTSMSSKLTKYKELERIVKNLLKYLQDVMELPGVYSDDDLLAQLQLCKLYFKLTLSSGCLGAIYQSKGEYMKSLALHTDAHEQLLVALKKVGTSSELVLPKDLLSSQRIDDLKTLIKTGWGSVLALAEYEKSISQKRPNTYDPSLVERLASHSIRPEMVHLNNLFPLRPKLRPIPSKPTLFDLAFNYINYDMNEENQNDEPVAPSQRDLPSKKQAVVKEEQESSKKRGFLGIFGR